MRIPFTEDETDEALLEWLRTLDEQALTRILTRRPDALARPWPRRVDDVARRLGGTPSMWLALRQATTPDFELLGAIRVGATLSGGESVTTTRLAELVDGTVEQVETVLRDLRELALAWTDDDGRVRVADALSDEFGYEGYGFGPPLRNTAWRATVDQLKPINAALGLPATGRKQQLIDALLAHFATPEHVRELADAAPDDTRELLLDTAWHGPYLGSHVGYLFYRGGRRPQTAEGQAIAWAVQHGLAWPAEDGRAVLPMEVALALRGPAYRLPFTPDPPRLDTRPVGPDSVATECAAAAMRMVDRVGSVLRSAAADPIPLLKSGGVGVRAVRGLAKSMGATADEVRLAVELACAAGFLMPAEPA